MAFHCFGLMPRPPQEGERFDRFEPENYGCIRVHDDLISDVLPALNAAETFWHTTDVSGRGLDEAGITLIPPDSASVMAQAIKDRQEISELTGLLNTACRTQTWLIHFGI